LHGQSCGVGQSAFLVHLFLLQVVQVACFAFALLTGFTPAAITDVAAKAIASKLKLTFFILKKIELLNN
jgi:hypothetical protein